MFLKNHNIDDPDSPPTITAQTINNQTPQINTEKITLETPGNSLNPREPSHINNLNKRHLDKPETYDIYEGTTDRKKQRDNYAINDSN